VKELTIYHTLLVAWSALGVVVFIALFFIAAPYGRHVRKGWGYTVGNKLGWVLMEAPAPIVFAICFLLGSHAGITGIVFLVLWEAHYLHRAFIYPFSLRGAARRMPLSVVSFGFLFNVMNGYLNGRYIFTFSGGYDAGWLADPRFIIGAIIFISGFVINRQADQILRGLRQSGGSDYKISNRRLFRWVSSPNYLGEITIWTGWAIATWSWPGLVFAFWTVANLLPRARANHAWYKATFPDYPPERKALLPGLW
jgi:protein-S-isoprenylcysteine O-methyltransferase Ste14